MAWRFSPEICGAPEVPGLRDQKYPAHRRITARFPWRGIAAFEYSLSSINAKAQIDKIFQYLQPNSLKFGGLKEKAPIYIFTKPFIFSPSFT